MKLFIPSFIVMSAILLYGCKKEKPEISTIEILSARQIALCDYEVIIRSEIHIAGFRAELVFEDLTESAADDMVYELDLMKEYRQTDTFRYNIPRLNHSYRVKARLMLDDEPVSASEAVINATTISYTITVWPDFWFADPEKNIALKLSNNQQFLVEINYNNSYPAENIEVKLNKSISLDHNIHFDEYNYYNSAYMRSASGFIFLNDQVDAGIYDVYLYIDGIEFKADARIEVLKDHWSLINSEFPQSEKYQYATFTDGDNLYLTGGRYSIFYDLIPAVWKYNFTLNEWNRLNDFPAQNVEVMHANLEYQGIWYIAVENDLNNDSTVLWKYNMSDDSWQSITTYPGKGDDLTCFMMQGRFFAGGGRRRVNEDVITYYDLWSYDLAANSWIKCRDLPLDCPYPYTNSCTSGNLAYVYSFDKTLRSYDPAGDEWTLKSNFPGPERVLSNLVSLNGKIYLVGAENVYGQQLMDCWEYDASVNTWELVSFVPVNCIVGFAAPFQNSLLTGLGYSGLNQPNLYRMTP